MAEKKSQNAGTSKEKLIFTRCTYSFSIPFPEKRSHHETHKTYIILKICPGGILVLYNEKDTRLAPWVISCCKKEL